MRDDGGCLAATVVCNEQTFFQMQFCHFVLYKEIGFVILIQ